MPRMPKHAALLLPALLIGACTTLEDVPTERLGEASLRFANGVPAGTAQLLGNGATVSIAVAVAGLEPGEHGFHLHAVGSCAAPGFTSAGGHLNPAGNSHGHLSPDGKHLGDLPNIRVTSGRAGSIEADLAGTRQSVLDQIFDADGTAVVVHAGPDDYRTDPSGDSGARIACGVLERTG